MECVQNLRHKHLNLLHLLSTNIVKYVINVSSTYEEEQRKIRYNENLAKKIAGAEAQVAVIAAEQAKAEEEKKRILQKDVELKVKLKRETTKAQELQLAVDKERARIEELERLSKSTHDKVNLLLKPYHDILGVTFQHCSEPEVCLRILFQMPNGKYCVIKLTKNGFRVIKCVPMLKDLDKLEAHLAKTNDFSGFVVHMRNRFLKEVAL
ncbi:uncharacterized protein LOC130699978 [Daphnia carinata]|uniref:uncharacterized protein LOC130699978 n=1 Tax=Daphnia carinata TaxID=120202 RepID=UPI00257ED79A|nr:uncharacterized protein LOC130699978 [Daphnia carinata]